MGKVPRRGTESSPEIEDYPNLKRVQPSFKRAESGEIPVAAAAGADPSSGVEADPGDLAEIESEDTDFFDNLNELFADSTQRVKVQVIRVAPSYVGETKMQGYVCYLKPGQDIEWLADNYGGGSYRIIKWVNGQKVESVNVDIAGLPIIRKPGSTPAPATLPASPSNSLDGLEFMGVKANGDDAQFFNRLERIMVMQSVLEKRRQPDMNMELMRVFLDKANSNSIDGMLDAFTKLKDVAEAIMPAEKTSDNGFMGVLGEALKAFTAVASQNRQLPAPVPAPAQAPVAALSAPRPAAPAVVDSPAVQSEGGNVNLSEANQVAQTCVNALVNAYGTQTPEEAVEGIKLVLPELTPMVKSLIKSQRAGLWSLTRMAANEAYDSFEVGALEGYFDQVMNLLTVE